MKATRTNIDVGGVLGTGRELHVLEAVTLPEFSSFRFAAPVDVSLRIRRIGRGVELKGTFAGEAAGICARCLDDVRFPLQLEVDEQFEPGGDADQPLGENNVLTGDILDLQDLVRQSVDSALPLVLVCDEACAGLCASCGAKRDGPCHCTNPE